MTEIKAEEHEGLSAEDVAALTYLPISGAMEKWSDVGIDTLNRRLSDVCNAIEEAGGVRNAYDGKLRTAYVTLQCLLNRWNAKAEHGVSAPAFRKRLKLAHRPVGREKDLSNDTQIVDLHYFWLLGHRGCDHAFGSYAFGTSFDFDNAYRFVRTAGTSELKLELLGLEKAVGKGSCRLGATSLRLSSDGDLQRRVAGRRNSLTNGLDTARLSNGTNKPLWVTLLIAEEILAGVKLQPDNQRLTDMVAILTGEPVGPERRLMGKLQSAKAKIGPVLSR